MTNLPPSHASAPSSIPLDSPTLPISTSPESLLTKTHAFAKDYMSQPHFDASHNHAHILRVLALSQHLLRTDQILHPSIPYDPLVVTLAALLHDVGDKKYLKPSPSPVTLEQKAEISNQINHLPEEKKSAALKMIRDNVPDPKNLPINNLKQNLNSLPDPTLHHLLDFMQSNSSIPSSIPSQTDRIDPQTPVKTTLKNLGASEILATKVQTIVTAVSYSTELKRPDLIQATLAKHPELAIVQDADRLDALGAVGIGRTFTYGGAKGGKGGEERGMEETMDHFSDKLLKLEGMMKTVEGRRMARERTERLRVFRGWWNEECGFGDGKDG